MGWSVGFKKRKIWSALLVFLLFSGCMRAVPGQAGNGDRIRVLVLSDIGSLNVKVGENVWRVMAGARGTAIVNGTERRLPVRFYPEGDFIYLNNRPYRGDIEIVDGGKGLDVIDQLHLETYVAGIINNEISSRWPEDAIKSQAIIARTYALYQMRKKSDAPYDIEGSVMGQVYNGAGAEDPAAFRAVNETRGEILTYGGEPALTVYHSNAGGMTESAKDIWFHYYPYLLSVPSPYDSEAPNFYWEFTLAADTLKDLLESAGYAIGRPEAVYPENVNASGRVITLVIKDRFDRIVKISGEDLRKIIGYSTLKSAIFEVTLKRGLLDFKGRGSGHGVGLSQWGAKGMAEKGYSYREILEHYYPGTVIERAY